MNRILRLDCAWPARLRARLNVICLSLALCPWGGAMAGNCPDLAPIIGAGTVPDLLISAIDPGEWIEVYNPGNVAYDFSESDGDLCEPFLYARFDVISPGTVLQPGAYLRLPWPGNFTQSSEAGGQIIIYNFAGIHDQDDIADFVCWGTGDGARKSQAEAVSKWIGPCTGAISPGQTIRRLVGTDGVTAASYDTNAPPEDCGAVIPLEYADGFEGIEE